jgi:hypothetical protein
MSRESPPDPELARRHGALAVLVRGLDLRTRGLSLFDHAEIAATVEDRSEVAGARDLLLRFIGYVVHGGGRLGAGAEVQVGEVRVRLESRSDGVLEIHEEDDRGRWRRGASRTVRRLAGEGRGR